MLATLLPDPGDPEKRAELLKAIGGEVKIEREESKDEDGNLIVEEKPVVHDGVLAWNAEDSEFMQSLRAQIRAAHGGEAPKVFDPFAGGGAIPYEAMWLGCQCTASDLNPVAWLLLKGTLEYPQRYAGRTWRLPDFVKEWADFLEDFHTGGRWVLDKARADLADHYPIVNGEPTVAYPPEKRVIPKADYKVVHQGVAAAVARGDLWLVFGNDSVLGEKPTDLQLDADASLYRAPTRLRAMDLLPGALAAAWSGTSQKTTVGRLYAELKVQKGKPWATKQFMEVLNEAVNQGVLSRGSAGPDYTSLTADSHRELKLPAPGTPTPIPKPPPSGAKETSEVTLDLAQLQDFVEEVAPALTKLLAGAAPEFAVRVRLKGRTPGALAAANEVLKKINPDWQFGE